MSEGRETKNAWVELALGVHINDGGPGDGAARVGVRLTHAMMVWNSARMHVGQQLDTLRTAILKAAQGDEQYPDIVDGLGNLDAIMDRLDDRLGEKLSAIRFTKDSKEKAALAKQARDVVKQVEAYLASDPLIADIDTKNGFVTLDIKPKVTEALNTMLEML